MSDHRIGTIGGLGGEAFDDYVLPDGVRLAEIHVMSSQYVHGLQFVGHNANGESVTLPSLGSPNGDHSVFHLGKDEYLVGISGLADWYIDRIQFHTSHRVSPSYGGDGTDRRFHLEMPTGIAVVGLFGRSGWHIDALGIIGAPVATPAERTARVTDLQKVEGIGPKIAELLVANGIYDLADLAKTPVERLSSILKGAGARFAIANPQTWPAQAALGASGDWAAMEAMQKNLRAGRKD